MQENYGGIMKYKICLTKNVARLAEAGDALINRAPGMPGMGLVYGPTGYGKTTATAWFVNQVRGVYVRAMALWSPSSFLAAVQREIDIEPQGGLAQQAEAIIEHLMQRNRPLFVDEADYLLGSTRMVETLRDLHDMATVPVILIGMDGMQRKIQVRQQLTGRLAEWVAFGGADIEDARILADTLSEVKIGDDLLAMLHEAGCPKDRQGQALGGASVRNLIVGLARIERLARAKGLKTVHATHWPRGRDFFWGKAPLPMPAAPVVSLAEARG
jgi:hypothetical protein